MNENITPTDLVVASRTRRRPRWLAAVAAAVVAALAAVLAVGLMAPASAQTWHAKGKCYQYAEACITHARVDFNKHKVRFQAVYRWSLTARDIVLIDTQRPRVNPGPEYVITYAEGDGVSNMSHVTRAKLTRIGSVRGAIRKHHRHSCTAKVHVKKLAHAQRRVFTFPRHCFHTRAHGPVAHRVRVMFASSDGPGADHWFEDSVPSWFSHWIHAA